MQTHTWDVINRDVRTGLFLIAATAQEMLGDNDPASILFAKAIFGPTLPDNQNLAGFIHELEDLDDYNVEHTRIWKVAKACFDFVHDNETPLDEIDVDHFEDTSFRWLHQFLHSIPQDSYTTSLGEHNSLFRDGAIDHALPQLLRSADAKMELIRFIGSGILVDEYELGMSPIDLAQLAEMSLPSVRNCIGPAGSNRPIRSRPHNSKEVYAEPLDALEWLAGRRNYKMAPLSPEWLTEPQKAFAHMPHIKMPSHFRAPQSAGSAIGVFAWVNKITTDELAHRSGLPVEAVRAWTRGDISVGTEHARALAIALKVDVEKYVAAIETLLSADPATTARP